MRLDHFLVENNLSRSRARAKEAIKSGHVIVNGKIITKASFEVENSDEVECNSEEKYVSRGGYKLEKAINEFSLDLSGVTAVDIGASTGGFSDCMLQNGVKEIFAIDSGHGQLAEKIKADFRVKSFEGCNIRDFDVEILPEIQFICVDVSFISLKYVFPKIAEILTFGQAVCLIKPQFETGNKKGALNKNGIVKDIKIHEQIIIELREDALKYGLYMESLTTSPIKGGDGNREYLCLLKAESTKLVTDKEVKSVCADLE